MNLEEELQKLLTVGIEKVGIWIERSTWCPQVGSKAASEDVPNSYICPTTVDENRISRQLLHGILKKNQEGRTHPSTISLDVVMTN